MDTMKITKQADWLEDNVPNIVDKKAKLDVPAIYASLNDLAILRQPVEKYFDMTEEEYYENESDHKLTLQDADYKLNQLHDRILVNHVDGSFSDSKIHFTYNHEDPYANGEYTPKNDLHTIEYALEVIGAVANNTIIGDLRNNLSKDAVLTISLAANAVDNWQKGNN